MPYYFDAVEEPKTGSQGWGEIEEIWQTIKNDLLGVIFENKQEAIVDKFRPHKDKNDYRFFNWSLIRFRC